MEKGYYWGRERAWRFCETFPEALKKGPNFISLRGLQNRHA